MVHSTENGVLWHTDMSMEQDWEMHFLSIYMNPKTQNFPSTFKHGEASGRHYIKQIIHQS